MVWLSMTIERARAQLRARRPPQGQTRVFVYGSLMRGLHNNRVLHRGLARFIATDRTRRSFSLYDLGSFPAMVTGGKVSVVGEVWEVSSETLADLDRLEGHPAFYTRTKITLASGRRAHAYVMPAQQIAKRLLVSDGDWQAHLASRSSG